MTPRSGERVGLQLSEAHPAQERAGFDFEVGRSLVGRQPFRLTRNFFRCTRAGFVVMGHFRCGFAVMRPKADQGERAGAVCLFAEADRSSP